MWIFDDAHDERHYYRWRCDSVRGYCSADRMYVLQHGFLPWYMNESQ